MSQKVFIPLEDVRVANPCHADWNMMDGNERVKFCGSCRKNVYNLSALTRLQAEDLIAEHEGEICVRYYQRADGTIMTQDCPVGLAMVRRAALAPLKYLTAGTAFLLAYGACIFGYRASLNGTSDAMPLSDTRTFKFLTKLASPTPTPVPPPEMVTMGAPPVMMHTPTPRAVPTPAYTRMMGKPMIPHFRNAPDTTQTQE